MCVKILHDLISSVLCLRVNMLLIIAAVPVNNFNGISNYRKKDVMYIKKLFHSNRYILKFAKKIYVVLYRGVGSTGAPGAGAPPEILDKSRELMSHNPGCKEWS